MDTERQRQLLRFWDKGELEGDKPEEIGSWLDKWNHDRSNLAAWTLWRWEMGDCGESPKTSTTEVPLGCGVAYKRRLLELCFDDDDWEDLHFGAIPGGRFPRLYPEVVTMNCLTTAPSWFSPLFKVIAAIYSTSFGPFPH